MNEVVAKDCRACGKPFSPTQHLKVYCSTKCRDKRQRRNKKKAWRLFNNMHREERRAHSREYGRLPEVRARKNDAKRSDEYKERRREYRQNAAVKEKESAAFAQWQSRNRERRSQYQLNYDRRNLAVKYGKEDFATKGDFKLIRTLPNGDSACFWRPLAIHLSHAANEEIVAFYERSGGAWTILPPANASDDIKRVVAILVKREAGSK